MTDENRLMELELAVADLQRTVEELNAELIRLNKIQNAVEHEVKELKETVDISPVKPLSEETPPPHY